MYPPRYDEEDYVDQYGSAEQEADVDGSVPSNHAPTPLLPRDQFPVAASGGYAVNGRGGTGAAGVAGGGAGVRGSQGAVSSTASRGDALAAAVVALVLAAT